MADKEKVIKGLECCTADLGIYHKDHFCDMCPYKSHDPEITFCFNQNDLMRDALELLKAQEPLKPVLKQFKLGFHTDAVRIEPCCGGCGRKLETWYKYCSYCGRAVKWDEPPKEET